MSKGIVDLLYKVSITTGKLATKLNDVKTVASGDPVKITNRIKRKAVNKMTNELRKNINKKIK